MTDVIRFAVGKPHGARSATWRVWKHRTSDDVYVAARRIAGQFKVSLHKDGTWLWGFSREQVEGPGSVKPPDAPRQRRFTPTETGPGLIRAVTVFVPSSEVVVPSYGGSEYGPIYWFPTPVDGRMACFTVSFTSPGTPVTGWPGRRGMGTNLVGSFELSTAWRGWVTVHEDEVPEESARAWAERKAALRFERKNPEGEPFDIRAAGHDFLDDGSFYFVDLFWGTSATRG